MAESLPFDQNHTLAMPCKVALALCKLATTRVPADIESVHRYPYDVLAQHVRLQVKHARASLMHTNSIWAIEASWTLDKGRENQGDDYSKLLDARLLAASIAKGSFCEVCTDKLEATRINADYARGFSMDSFFERVAASADPANVDMRLLKIVAGAVASAGAANALLQVNGDRSPVTITGYADDAARVYLQALLMPIVR
jgi:hypothetical protein